MTANLSLVERAVDFACARYRLDRDAVDEIRSEVLLRLVDHDYAILRGYEERSSFRKYISVVVQHLVIDYQTHEWGKWHASAEAKRLGEVAVDLERLLHRDKRSFDDAVVILMHRYRHTGGESLRVLAERLPSRAPRPRAVAIEEVPSLPPARGEAVEHRVVAGEQRNTSARVSAVLAAFIAGMPEDERLMLQFHFQNGLTVAEIARMFRGNQRQLYDLIKKRTREMHAAVRRAGISPRDVLDLIGSDYVDLDFHFGKPPARPSVGADDTHGGNSEAPQ